MIYLNYIFLQVKSAHNHLMMITSLTQQRIDKKEQIKPKGFLNNLKQSENNLNSIELYFKRLDKEITRLKRNEKAFIKLVKDLKAENIKLSKQNEELKQNIEL